MDSTTEAVTKTVVNKNTVKLALDEYNDLITKAARPVLTNVTVLRKTNVQNAQDNMVYGACVAAVGAVVALAGFVITWNGKRKLK